jgi:Domain of unknown function (DUF222)
MTDSGEPLDGYGPNRPEVGRSPASQEDVPPGPHDLPGMVPDGDGLRWSFEFDLVSTLEALGRPLRDWDGVDQEADLAAEVAALGFADAPPRPADDSRGPADDSRGPADDSREPCDGPADDPPGEAGPAGVRPGRGRDLAGAIAEVLPTGPGLAAWLAGQDPAAAAGRDLAGMAGAFRRVASWAQARELELIAHLAARSAAADPKAGLRPDGRPAHVTDDAAAQVSLELTLSRTGAEAWTGLAVALRWRLPATAAALAEGRIDTYRAKIVAEAVIPLSDRAARAVENQVISHAGDLTYGQMHTAVRRAVIAADPEGAEHRRQAAERRAKVSLYPGQDGTATLVGAWLPAPEAAAAMARICAVAQALKAAGAGGGIHFLRSQALIGLILQTLPFIPPPAGGPPDNDPPPDDSDDGWTPGPDGEPPGDASHPPGERPDPDGTPGGTPGPDGTPGGAAGPGRRPGPCARPAARTGPLAEPAPAADPWPRHPPPTDADLPEDDGYRDTGPPPGGDTDWDPARGDPLDDHFADPGIQWPWPLIPPTVPATPAGIATATSGGAPARPPPDGLLDLTLPWATFTGQADAPGTLGRIGPITAPQARKIGSLGLRDPRTQWRIILTDADARAIAVARIPRPPGPGRPAAARPAGAATTATVGRVTIVIPARVLDTAPAPSPRLPGGTYARILTTATRARDRARRQAEADQHAPGGCAHTTASPAYRPPPRTREYIAARDQTCRQRNCGQPAWRSDLDHTIPYDQGGLTCPCDLGPLCRRDHQLKQHPGWTLTQPRPGTFQWTTPNGRTYLVEPDRYYAG